MARIPDGTFKDWKDNDVISASDYKMEREVLKAAINDLDNLLKTADPNSFASRLIEVENNYVKKVERKFTTHTVYYDGWTKNTQDFAYHLDPNGIVWLRGDLKYGLKAAGKVLVFNLPAAIRPPVATQLTTSCYNNDAQKDEVATIIVQPNGEIQCGWVPTNHSLKFSGLSYAAF
ncbi:hypothetical protein PDQ70_16580 [Bacillus cereus group sp. Bc011]|uniref:hypothetical protein n=1 Tax=unclassified Bacillus cereus group TaxID=2750818 RepID=UPI0022E11CB5|nr:MULTISPECIES: hypothetical protein [unclassified Bacillus cereus group]MDA2681091.1 hypothetical protein [Bacillus cereus group sp. Bc029]MDA2742075.1 hypothetical protein [Bacillus cereus group sp. Bc011]